MAMNVKPVPTLNDEVNEIRLATAEIINKDILPNEHKLWVWVEDSANSQNEVGRANEARELRQHVQSSRSRPPRGTYCRPQLLVTCTSLMISR